MKQDNINNAPWMDEMKHSSSPNKAFRVPEGYFDTLPHTIMQRIHQESAPASNKKVTRRRSRFFIRLTAAAVLTGFFSLAGIMMYEQSFSTDRMADNTQLAEIFDLESTDETLDYAMLNNTDIEYFLTVAD
jgi:hypothetical protein